MQNNKKRLEKELFYFKNKPIDGVNAFPLNNDLTEWECIIKGPKNSPYENGIFHLLLKIPSEYPLKPPILTFKTKIFHPNISNNGNICLDILNSKHWSPEIFIQKLLLMLISFLNEPNVEHGLNLNALNLYKLNKDKYNETVKEWTEMYAIEKK